MDFLEIRKKARERAARREAEERERRLAEEAAPVPDRPGPAGAAGPSPAPDPTPPTEPVVTDADVLEGELEARLQGVAPEPEARFTTWRPGESAPPVRAAAGAAPSPAPPGAAGRLPEGPLGPPAASSAPAEPRDPLDDFFYREDEEAPRVPSLGGRAAAPAGEEDPDSAVREEYLTFLLGAEEYAVAIERVREVMKSPPITEVPRAPAHVLGVVTVRGEVVAVIDPRRRLGLPPEGPAQGRVVIVDGGDGPCGLLVDHVADVVRLRPGAIEPCPQGLGGASGDCLAGIGREGDRLFTVLDLGALLRRVTGDRVKPGERHAGP